MNFARFKLLAKRYKWTIVGVLVLLGIFWFAIANASERHPPPPVKSVSHADAKSHSSSESHATSGDSTSSATSGDSTSSADNSLTNTVTWQGTRNNNTPGVYLGGLYPSAPCMAVANAGVSAPGFGIGGGKSYMDPECDKRETARSFMALGYTQEAMFILCSTEAARVLARCPFDTPAEPAKCSDAQCEQAIEKKMEDMRKVWEGGANEAGK